MGFLNDDQMSVDLQCYLAKDRNFLDHQEIPADPYQLGLIALGLRRRYYEQGNVADIDRASACLEIAMAISTATSPEWMDSVNGLSKTYFLYYMSTSNTRHLQRTIDLCEQLIEHANVDSHHFEFFLHYFASCLLIRSRLTRNTRDMARAKRVWRECLKCSIRTSQHKYVYISRLFYCVLAYNFLEDDVPEIEDVNEILYFFLDKISIEPSKYSMAIKLLGDYMIDCYIQNMQIPNLNTIIDCWEQSIHDTSSMAVDLPDLNRRFSAPFPEHFLDVKHTNDLQQAIIKQEKALSLCKPGSLRYVQNLHELGQALKLLYKHTNDLADLNHSIELFEQAMAVLSGSSPLQSVCRANLTEALQKRYKRTANITDLKRINQLRRQP